MFGCFTTFFPPCSVLLPVVLTAALCSTLARIHCVCKAFPSCLPCALAKNQRITSRHVCNHSGRREVTWQNISLEYYVCEWDHSRGLFWIYWHQHLTSTALAPDCLSTVHWSTHNLSTRCCLWFSFFFLLGWTVNIYYEFDPGFNTKMTTQLSSIFLWLLETSNVTGMHLDNLKW